MDLDNKNAVLAGAMAFDGDKKGAALDNGQCIAALLLRGDAKSVWDIFPSDEGGNINYSLSDCKSQVEVSTNGGLEFDIRVKAHASAYAVQSDSRLEAKIESRIKTLCENALEQLLKKKRLDVFNLKRTLYSRDYGFYKKLDDPKQSVVLSKVNVQVDIELRKN